MMQEETKRLHREKATRDAVKALRQSIKDDKGESISQTEFGRPVGKSLNTIQRYETLVPPRGSALMRLAEIAHLHNRTDLAELFMNESAIEMGVRPFTFFGSPMMALRQLKARLLDLVSEVRVGSPHSSPEVLEANIARARQAVLSVFDAISTNSESANRELIALAESLESGQVDSSAAAARMREIAFTLTPDHINEITRDAIE